MTENDNKKIYVLVQILSTIYHFCVWRSLYLVIIHSSNWRAVLNLGKCGWLAARNCVMEYCLNNSNHAFDKEKGYCCPKIINYSNYNTMLAFRCKSPCGVC